MPNFSGKWGLTEQLQAVAAGTWTGLPTYQLYAWGDGGQGRLGDGTTTYRSSPVQIGTLTNWAQVAGATSGYHTSAIKTDNTLWSWGRNSSGQLGLNDIDSRSSPVQIGTSTDWYQVSSGEDFTSSIKTNGTLWAWGANGNGQLGQSNVINRSSPVQVGALTNWYQVSEGGDFFTISVKTDGTLWAWGLNSGGALGIGTGGGDNKSSPVQIGALTTWAYAAAGDFLGAAIKTDGTLWIWGNNSSGQLGQSNLIARSSPVQVGGLTDWYRVAAGKAHVAALRTDGTLWTWGYNGTGCLGNGTVASQSSPIQVGALTNWSQVSCGETFTAAVKTDGTLWVWGSNGRGQLGQNNTIRRSSPVQVGALTNWSQVSAGVGSTFAIVQGSSN